MSGHHRSAKEGMPSWVDPQLHEFPVYYYLFDVLYRDDRDKEPGDVVRERS